MKNVNIDDSVLNNSVFNYWIQSLSDAIYKRNVIIRLETMPGENIPGIDAVAYDVSELQHVYNVDSFVRYVEENGMDEEAFEIDRCTVLHSQ